MWRSVPFDSRFQYRDLAGGIGALLWSEYWHATSPPFVDRLYVASWLKGGSEYSYAGDDTAIAHPCSSDDVPSFAPVRLEYGTAICLLRHKKATGILPSVLEREVASRSDDEILAFANVPWSTLELPWDWRMTLGLSITLSPRLQAALARIRNWWPGEYIGVHWRRDRDWAGTAGSMGTPDSWIEMSRGSLAKIRRVQGDDGVAAHLLGDGCTVGGPVVVGVAAPGIFHYGFAAWFIVRPKSITVELGLLEQELLAYRILLSHL